MPMLREDVIRALVDAAHKRSRLAVAHVDRLSEAKIAVRAGVDGLAHIFCDEVADQWFVDQLLLRNVFVIPTLTIRQAARAGESNLRQLEPDRALAASARQSQANFHRPEDGWTNRSVCRPTFVLMRNSTGGNWISGATTASPPPIAEG